MGEEKVDGKLYYKSGETWIECAEISKAPGFQPDIGTQEKYHIDDFEKELVVHFRAEKHMRCANRKRFIKLLMSVGVPRNSAVMLADETCKQRMPYSAAWWWLKIMHYELGSTVEKI